MQLRLGTSTTNFGHLRSPVKVLVAVAQLTVGELVRLALLHGQFLCQSARNGSEVAMALAEWRPHLAIIDMDIAAGAHLDLVWATGHIPVIALTRRGDLQTKLAAFERGVDDILTVPFFAEELVARTLAIVRRAYRVAIALTPVLRMGDLDIDILRHRARSSGQDLHLTSLELNLLYLLAANLGRVLTREEILDCLWGVDHMTGSNIVDRHMRNLRAKLRDDWRRPRFIATVAGRGYRFVATRAVNGVGTGPESLEAP